MRKKYYLAFLLLLTTMSASAFGANCVQIEKPEWQIACFGHNKNIGYSDLAKGTVYPEGPAIAVVTCVGDNERLVKRITEIIIQEYAIYGPKIAREYFDRDYADCRWENGDKLDDPNLLKRSKTIIVVNGLEYYTIMFSRNLYIGAVFNPKNSKSYKQTH